MVGDHYNENSRMFRSQLYVIIETILLFSILVQFQNVFNETIWRKQTTTKLLIDCVKAITTYVQ